MRSLHSKRSHHSQPQTSNHHHIQSNLINEQILKYNAGPGTQKIKIKYNGIRIFKNLELTGQHLISFHPLQQTPFPRLSSTQSTTSRMHSIPKTKRTKKENAIQTKKHHIANKRNNQKHIITMHINQEVKKPDNDQNS